MNHEDTADVGIREQWLLWGSLVFSMFTYAGLAVYLGEFADFERGDGFGVPYVPAIVGLVGLVELGVAFWIRGLEHEDEDKEYAYKMISWGLTEGVAIYGLCLWFFGEIEYPLLGTFIGLAIISMLPLHPGR